MKAKTLGHPTREKREGKDRNGVTVYRNRIGAALTVDNCCTVYPADQNISSFLHYTCKNLYYTK
jgi:hypothetical protein